MALDLLERILNDFQHVGRMLRRSIKEEVGLDIDDLEKRVHDVFARDDLPAQQDGLFASEEQD